MNSLETLKGIKAFTFKDYIEYKRLEEDKLILEVREPEEEYHIEKRRINKKYDKTMKLALSNEEQVAAFINEVLNLKNKITANDIVKYTNSFTSKEFKSSEADIVYKLNNKNIFFLIECQSTIDYLMPKRILHYQTGLIASVTENHTEKMKKGEKFPAVIPIVIYTGERNWNIEQNYESYQETLDEKKLNYLGHYYIVDVNDYKEEDILKENELFLKKVIYLQRVKDANKITHIVEQIIKTEKDELNIELLYKIVGALFEEKLGEEKLEELLSKIKDRKEEDNMMLALETIRKENAELLARGRREGRRECRKEIINSLKQKMGKKEKIEITLKDLEELISQASKKVS